MIVVADSGPLIALAQIGSFRLLQLLYGQLYIPRVVEDEIVTSGGGRPGMEEVDSAPWIRVVNVRDTTAVQLLRERLDAGESEAIVLAIELEADLLLVDEARGRRIAEARGLNVMGTLGTLLMAKKQGLITAVTSQLDVLVTSGFHITKELYQAVRMLADEAANEDRA